MSILLWVLLFLCRVATLASPASSGPGEAAFGIGATIASVTAFVAFATSIGADLYYVMVSIDGINWLAVGDRLDLVRLTSMGDEDILAAGYALVQLRVWSMTFFEVAIRIVGIMFILAPAIFQVLFGRRDPYTPSDLGQLGTVAGVAVVAALAAPYILEPLWPMRAFFSLAPSPSLPPNPPSPHPPLALRSFFLS